MTKPVTTGTVPVNGLEMYYEVYGEGKPLVLLHGAFSAIDSSFGALMPGLAEGRRSSASSCRPTGDRRHRPSAEHRAMADDVAAAIEQLGLGPADLFGYSMGAFVALLLVTLRHPELVRKLVFVSATYTLERCPSGLSWRAWAR